MRISDWSSDVCSSDLQQPKPLRALYDGRKVQNGLEVAKIALERCCRHEKMMAHKPGHNVRFSRAEAKARAKIQCDFSPDHTMIAAPAFGDVMQQQRDIERPARQKLPTKPQKQRRNTN